MALVTLKTMLDKAYQKRYAVGAFNVINLNFLEAIILAARHTASPVVLNIAEVHFPFVTMEYIVPVVREIVKRERFDVVLNLDHGKTIDAIERALANGFTSIMFDGSHLDFDENVQQTREVARMCHAWNISIEAELGAVGGAEGGGLVGDADPAKYTDVGQAKTFVEQTGIDALAVAIGNSHGRSRASQTWILSVCAPFGMRLAFRWFCMAVRASRRTISAWPYRSVLPRLISLPGCRKRPCRQQPVT